jgi:hypothetical protein
MVLIFVYFAMKFYDYFADIYINLFVLYFFVVIYLIGLMFPRKITHGHIRVFARSVQVFVL